VPKYLNNHANPTYPPTSWSFEGKVSSIKMSVQDPSFWKRFSRAVHLDEAAAYTQPNVGWIESRRPELKHSYDSPLMTSLAPLDQHLLMLVWF
jgi:hypothetical protein